MQDILRCLCCDMLLGGTCVLGLWCWDLNDCLKTNDSCKCLSSLGCRGVNWFIIEPVGEFSVAPVHYLGGCLELYLRLNM